MRIERLETIDRSGRPVILRSAEVSDAADMIEYLRVTSGETRFLIREPDEVRLTVEQEEAFLQSRLDAEKSCMIVAEAEGRLAGTCAVMPAGPYRRYAHRCEMAVALYQAFCGRGIGRMLMERGLALAKGWGYEQAELEVVAGNTRAMSLYESLGFEPVGRLPRNMKYADGTYADAIRMVRKL